MSRPYVRRVLPLRQSEIINRALPTRGSVELRLYDFDAQAYKYVPGLRVQCVITSEAELRKLWALIERVIVVHEDKWRDPIGLDSLKQAESTL
jgi:hypothetical protein